MGDRPYSAFVIELPQGSVSVSCYRESSFSYQLPCLAESAGKQTLALEASVLKSCGFLGIDFLGCCNVLKMCEDLSKDVSSLQIIHNPLLLQVDTKKQLRFEDAREWSLFFQLFFRLDNVVIK